ncbi:hypothetical protein BKA62DRAFT_305301 [Auriculariales sp. MPI-PUGE-AT-0066]|nr:hypothetical protein BKA62DRAFT_305301 [Auriculariales sp. MPI-PUGE-AT-0066]
MIVRVQEMKQDSPTRPTVSKASCSVIGPFEDETARDTIDMVLDCILDDHPELDGILVDSLFRFDERMFGPEAATFRREVLVVETQSTPSGRFGVVKSERLDCPSCGTRCYGRVGLLQHVALCMAHQQLLQRMGQEWAQRARRAQRAGIIKEQLQEQEQAQVHQLPEDVQDQEDAQEPTEMLDVEQAFDLLRQVMELEDVRDPAMEQAAESAMEKVLLHVEDGKLQPEPLLDQLGRLPPRRPPQQLERQVWRLQRQLVQLEQQEGQLERKEYEAQRLPNLQRQQLQWRLNALNKLRRRGEWQTLLPWQKKWELRQLEDAQVQVHRAHQLHQAQKQAQKAQKQARSEVRWGSVRQNSEREHTTMEVGNRRSARSD